MYIVIINQRKQEWYFVKHELEESVELYKGENLNSLSAPLPSLLPKQTVTDIIN